MKKNIIIVGGGISGLSTLHFLRKKYGTRSDISFKLLEKAGSVGGKIHTDVDGGCLFEQGPNGFINDSPRTLELIEDLGLESRLIQANKVAKKRFILSKGELHRVPMAPKGLLSSELLSFFQKLRVFMEPFVGKKNLPEETVYDFVSRRFGEAVAEKFADPFVKGVFGGDARELILSQAFPKIFDMEQRYGSVINALKAQQKIDEEKPKKALYSFQLGMIDFITALDVYHNDYILTSSEVSSIIREGDHFLVNCSDKQHKADYLFLTLPAYAAQRPVSSFDPNLAHLLNQIPYAPIGVMGLVFAKNKFDKLPEGFGYLIPSTEQSPVLGVLFESNIFPHRAPDSKMNFRVMMGGVKYPEFLTKSSTDLLRVAIEEIKDRYKFKSTEPIDVFCKVWPKAIPQYDLKYLRLKEEITECLDHYENLNIVANYWNGVSMNDCIENSFRAVEKLAF